MATSVRVFVYNNNNGQTYGDHQEQPHILLPRDYLIRFYVLMCSLRACVRIVRVFVKHIVYVCVFSSKYTVNI